MSSLTPTQRVQARLNGQPVDRAPNFDIIMAFGVHHVAACLSEYYLDYRLLGRMNLEMLEMFELDLVQAISDPFREAADFGVEVEFPQDGLPYRKRPLLNNPVDLKDLKKPDPYTGMRMSDRLEGIRLMKERVGNYAPVMGWVEGALAEANILRGDSAMLFDLYDRPEWVHELLEICTEVAIDFARAQVQAGATIIGLGDAIASQISRKMYIEYALPYEKRILNAVREMGAIARLHICGDTSRILAEMAETGAHIIDIDAMVDFGKAAAEMEQHASDGLYPVVCGNIDPVRVLYEGTPAMVYQATWDALEAGGARCFAAAGCEIPDDTPHANLRAQVQAIKDFGTR